MNRDQMLERLSTRKAPWDLVIIGGGATGLGAAVDAASRGHAVLLLEQADFAKGTSSRSTKLVHGGVRYLAQGDLPLVIEALRERGLLLRNAPHLVHHLPFIIPSYTWWEGPFYSVGMKVYDAMAGRLGLGPSTHLSPEAVCAAIPNLDPRDLRGGVRYFDGQFDDARLAVHLALTAADHGAVLLNYCGVTSLRKGADGTISGVHAVDAESGQAWDIPARVVVNATGVFVDDILRMDAPGARPLVALSQGVHLVLPKRFLRGDAAIMIPHTDDGRVLFAVPWQERVVVGTTDTPVTTASLEPRALASETDFILNTVARYLAEAPTRRDVLSVFAGLRPLAAPAHADAPTRELSRGHQVLVSPSGLVSIVGGKWTTYRKMAEDVVDTAQTAAGLDDLPCRTHTLAIHGANAAERPDVAEPRLHPDLPLHAATVRRACEAEMARCVEDVLSRRSRALLLDARAAIAIAPAVARLMAGILGRPPAWVDDQIRTFTTLARGYVLDDA